MTANYQNILKAIGRTVFSITCIMALLVFSHTGTVFAAETELSGESAAAAAESDTVIGEEAAQNYAFSDADIDPADVETVFTEYERDDGQYLYDVDFTVDGTEYEYHIGAYDGSILKKSIEYVSLRNTVSASADSDNSVTSGQAKEIALADTGLSEEELAIIIFTKEKSDYEDGLYVYEFEFSTENMSYEYEISQNTGDILSVTEEVLTTANRNTESETADSASAVSEAADTGLSLDEAKAIALEMAGLSESDVIFKKAKLDKEDGIMVYEIEFYQGQMEYECEINASTGAIIEFEAEWDD